MKVSLCTRSTHCEHLGRPRITAASGGLLYQQLRSRNPPADGLVSKVSPAAGPGCLFGGPRSALWLRMSDGRRLCTRCVTCTHVLGSYSNSTVVLILCSSRPQAGQAGSSNLAMEDTRRILARIPHLLLLLGSYILISGSPPASSSSLLRECTCSTAGDIVLDLDTCRSSTSTAVVANLVP